MTDDWKWLLDIDVRAAGIALTVLIGAFYRLHSVMSASIADVAKSVKAGDDALHSRINQVRDEYVRRHDMDVQMDQLRESVRELREELRTGIRETNKRLDQIIAAMAREKG